MSVNDFDQTVPLPTNGEETTPLPVGNDAPEVPQPASASDETATLPSGLVPETRELPVTEDAAPSSAEQSEADAEVSDAPAGPPSESTPHASSGASSTYTSPQAGSSASLRALPRPLKAMRRPLGRALQAGLRHGQQARTRHRHHTQLLTQVLFLPPESGLRRN